MIARLLTLLLTAVISHSAFAIDAKPIKWSDLQPDSVSLRSTVSNLNPEQKSRLMRAYQQRQHKAIVAASRLKPSEMSIDTSTLLKEDFSDLKPLMAQIDSFEKNAPPKPLPVWINKTFSWMAIYCRLNKTIKKSANLFWFRSWGLASMCPHLLPIR